MAARHELILVVDDDPGIGEILLLLLEALGYEPVWVRDGTAALEVLETRTPGIILLDLMMPGMDGWKLRDELLRRPRLAGIPVVVMTGAGDAEVQGRAINAAASLEKPVDLTELQQVLEKLST